MFAAAGVAAAVTASAVTASAVRMSVAETLPAAEAFSAALEALRRMPAAPEVEATGTVTANTFGFVSSALVSSAKEMGTAGALCFSF